jgi:hypothetical protein
MGLLLREGKTLKPDARKGMLRVIRVSQESRTERFSSIGKARQLDDGARRCSAHLPPAALHAGRARTPRAHARRPRPLTTRPPRPQTEDGLVHLLWAERTDAGGVQGEAEMDAILFPQEAAFTLVWQGTPGEAGQGGCPSSVEQTLALSTARAAPGPPNQRPRPPPPRSPTSAPPRSNSRTRPTATPSSGAAARLAARMAMAKAAGGALQRARPRCA